LSQVKLHFFRGKKYLNNLATSKIFSVNNPKAKVNNRPIGESSPNPVTLATGPSYVFQRWKNAKRGENSRTHLHGRDALKKKLGEIEFLVVHTSGKRHSSLKITVEKFSYQKTNLQCTLTYICT
jgi:hypothetical protein